MLDRRWRPDALARLAHDAMEREQARQRLWVRLERVNAAMADAEEYEANALLPNDLRRELPVPVLSYEDLKDLRQVILDKLRELQAQGR